MEGDEIIITEGAFAGYEGRLKNDCLQKDIIMSLFGGSVNEQFLNPEILHITVFKKTIPANSNLMKLFTPR